MKEQPEGSEQEDYKSKVKPLILHLNEDKSFTFERISEMAGVSYHCIIDWKEGRSRPRTNNIAKNVVQRLEKVLEDLESKKSVISYSPEELKHLESKESVTPEELEKLESRKAGTVLSQEEQKDLSQGYKKMRSALVIIYFDSNRKTEPYTGEIRKIGAIVKVNGKEGIIAYENDSAQYGDADGLIYSDDSGLASYIKTGWIIAIKKINKTEWDPGYFYYVIGATGNRYLRKLFAAGQDKKEKKVRLVSDNENRYPAITFELNKIKVIFQVEKIIFKPE